MKYYFVKENDKIYPTFLGHYFSKNSIFAWENICWIGSDGYIFSGVKEELPPHYELIIREYV